MLGLLAALVAVRTLAMAARTGIVLAAALDGAAALQPGVEHAADLAGAG